MLKQVAAERWKQIKEIFDEAAELGESERVQYLDSALKLSWIPACAGMTTVESRNNFRAKAYPE